jgi:hypothetical protein
VAKAAYTLGIVKRFALVAFLYVVLVAGEADAQVEGVQPPHPTSADYIVLQVGVSTLGMTLQPVVSNGSTILITFRGAGELPSGDTHFVSLGRLPAGTYSVVVTLEFTDGGDDQVANTVTFPPFVLVVAAGAPDVPLLDFPALIMLIVAMATVAVLALSRQ